MSGKEVALPRPFQDIAKIKLELGIPVGEIRTRNYEAIEDLKILEDETDIEFIRRLHAIKKKCHSLKSGWLIAAVSGFIGTAFGVLALFYSPWWFVATATGFLFSVLTYIGAVLRKKMIGKLERVVDLELLDNLNILLEDHNAAVNAFHHYVSVEMNFYGKWEHIPKEMQRLFIYKLQELMEHKKKIAAKIGAVAHLIHIDEGGVKKLAALFKDTKEVQEAAQQTIESKREALLVRIGLEESA